MSDFYSKRYKGVIESFKSALLAGVGKKDGKIVRYLSSVDSDFKVSYGTYKDVSIRIPLSVCLKYHPTSISVTEVDGIVFLGIERCLKAEASVFGLPKAWAMCFANEVGLIEEWEILKHHYSNIILPDNLISVKAYLEWAETTDFERLVERITSSDSYKVRRVKSKLPCKGLNDRIVPIMAFDFENSVVRYLYGSKKSVCNLQIGSDMKSVLSCLKNGWFDLGIFDVECS
jgi:hypothetical protein